MALLLSALGSCSNKSDSIAEVTVADGEVERQVGSGAKEGARIGTQYYFGDAALTGAGHATLDVAKGGATVVMDDHTTVHFAGNPQKVEIYVVGQADLRATRAVYTLNGRSVTMGEGGGTVRVSARGGTPATVLVVDGKARITEGKEVYELKLGTPVDVKTGKEVPIDAGVRDAPTAADAAVDASEPASDGAAAPAGATIVVAGRAEVTAPGETKPTQLPPGESKLAPGSAVHIWPKSSARVIANGVALELGGGARLKLGDDLQMTLEAGGNTAESSSKATIALPGGALTLNGSPNAPAMARIDGNARDTKVSMMRGNAKLTGAAGAEHDMDRGESATLDRSGAIRYVDVIPRTFDFRVGAGESFTIHDPKPPTAVQFQFDGKCPDGGIIEIDRNGSFRTARVSGGRDFANAAVARGTWAYRLRCTTNGVDGSPVASGRITVLIDDGRRPLPKTQGTNEIDADGRTYRISYQSGIPNVMVRVRNPGATHRLHLASAGKEQTFDAAAPSITVPSSQLREGTYTYWIDRDGVKQEKTSTLIIDFDQTAPQVYIESPPNGQPWPGDIDVRGAVLPGWSAAVDVIGIPIDRQRRFSAKVGTPGGNALAIRLSHPQRGVHYYLRRSK